MDSILVKSAITSLFISLVTSRNVQVEYYKSATLVCDDPTMNLTTNSLMQANVQSKYWLTPSQTVIDNITIADQTRKGTPSWILGDWSSFNLTVNYVDDDDFGVYHCIVVMKDYSIHIIKQGLNEHGPSFEKLHEEYRHNAMVGGIAAAILFSIIFGSCVIWHFRFAKKKGKKEGMKYESNGYENQGTSYDTSVNSEKVDHGIVTSEKL